MNKGFYSFFVWISKQIYNFVWSEIFPFISQLIYGYLQTIPILICQQKPLRFLDFFLYKFGHKSKGTYLNFRLVTDKFCCDLVCSLGKFITYLALQ